MATPLNGQLRGHRDDRYRALSLWLDTAPGSLAPREALPGDRDTDVAVVGAGFTGLWTAYYLSLLDPSLRITVVEQEIAGFGASGRNGGWCSALFPATAAAIARTHGWEAARALTRAMQRTVDEVGRAAAAEGLDIHYRKGGTLAAVRSQVQMDRARAQVEEAGRAGHPDDLVLLGPTEAAARICVGGLLGATYTPHCAAIHPGRLARGLAEVVERRGVRIHEQTRVRGVEHGAVRTDRGTLRAELVVRATEGYTAGIDDWHRVLAPVYSLMLATAPLPAEAWERIGLARRETFTDHRHLVIYGQRTDDDRLAFGGRGAPYHFGSRIRSAYDRDPRVHADLRRTLVDLFPAADAPVTHTWGGPLGVPRDWHASVGLDRARGLAWAGGYVGDGVGTSNLAGRTLADLVLGRDTDLTRLPWVGHRSPRWEPEPLRWVGINLGRRLAQGADTVEQRRGRPARRAALLRWLTG